MSHANYYPILITCLTIIARIIIMHRCLRFIVNIIMYTLCFSLNAGENLRLIFSVYFSVDRKNVATATLENKSVGPKSEKDIAVAFRQKFIGVYNSLAFRIYRYFFKQFFSIIIHYILYTLTPITYSDTDIPITHTDY